MYRARRQKTKQEEEEDKAKEEEEDDDDDDDEEEEHEGAAAAPTQNCLIDARQFRFNESGQGAFNSEECGSDRREGIRDKSRGGASR